jgi:hypothetical protein
MNNLFVKRWRTCSTAVAFALVAGACASSTSSSATSAAPPMPVMQHPSPDPRIGLKGGMQDAQMAMWNLQLVAHRPSPEGMNTTNSDLAFAGSNVIQGNYNGFSIWDVSNPASPRLRLAKICPASQSDVSVYKNLLFVSAEAPSARLDCGATAPREAVSKDRIRGLRIFDITDIDNPKYLTNVQTCRGSHTHTVVTDPKDPNTVYVYISGTSGVRPAEELAGCVADADAPNTSQFNIEVIKVPLAHPEQAAVVSTPRIFADMSSGRAAGLAYPSSHGAAPLPPYATKADSNTYHYNAERAKLKPLTANSSASDSSKYNASMSALRAKYDIAAPANGRGFGGGRAGGNRGPRMITQCHDITVYPAVGLAGGACAGMGLLLDITDAAHPRRIDAVADSNFSFWHSATFSNDGSKVLFSDEWGGGGAAYCRVSDPMDWGADAIFTIDKNKKMHFQSYYKMPAAQTQFENCVAHNGSLIPVPGREVMVQSFYQGGITVFDWTDPKNPYEIAFFDRGPNDPTRLVSGGFWSSYWYNGRIYGSEEKRGLDVFELTPSPALSQNEIDAAKLVQWTHLNTQSQPKIVWPANIAVVRSYLDQLNRNGGISETRSAAISTALDAAMASSGSARRSALNSIASDLDKDVKSARDQARVRMMASAVRDLANAS